MSRRKIIIESNSKNKYRRIEAAGKGKTQQKQLQAGQQVNRVG